jgi:hypothetical protein
LEETYVKPTTIISTPDQNRADHIRPDQMTNIVFSLPRRSFMSAFGTTKRGARNLTEQDKILGRIYSLIISWEVPSDNRDKHLLSTNETEEELGSKTDAKPAGGAADLAGTSAIPHTKKE